MTHCKPIRLWILPLALCAAVGAADAQGKGQGKGQGQDPEKEKAAQARDKAREPAARGADKARPQQTRSDRAAARGSQGRGGDARARRGRSASAPNPSDVARERASSNARFKRNWSSTDIRPALRRFIGSNRPAEVMTAGAVAHAHARKVRDDALVITTSGRQMLVRNRKGDLLVALDDARARNLGAWQVRPLDDRVGEGAPSFCRSGEGHPVWGSQWCLDKGFGIGVDRDRRWGRTADLGDVVFRREPVERTLTREALRSVLGDVVVDRLALHAITLGLVDPLVGTWRSEATGPRVLLVDSGDYRVAEIVDVNRDRRGDMMLVALRPW